MSNYNDPYQQNVPSGSAPNPPQNNYQQPSYQSQQPSQFSASAPSSPAYGSQQPSASQYGTQDQQVPAYQQSTYQSTQWPTPEKKGPSKGLIIGLSVGGGVLLLAIIGIILIVSLVFGAAANRGTTNPGTQPPVVTQPADPGATDPGTTEPAPQPTDGGNTGGTSVYDIAPVESTGDADADAQFDAAIAQYTSPNDDPLPFADNAEARGFGLEVCRLLDSGDEQSFVALFESVLSQYAYGSGYAAGAAVTAYCGDQYETLLDWATTNGL